VKRAAFLVAICLVLMVPATAPAKREEASAGGVTAVLTYTCPKSAVCKDFKLKITRNGVQLVSDSLTPSSFKEAGIAPGRPVGKSVLVTDLDRDGEREVVVDLYSGGAHCCFYSLIYGYRTPPAGYDRTYHPWGDAGYTLRDIGHNGIKELSSGDYRFAYAFSSFAESRFPVQIWHYAGPGAKLKDVTRRFRRQVRRQARRLFRAVRGFRRQHLDIRGLLAAYQADNYNLGRKRAARGWRQLRALARKGRLKRPRGGTGPSGKRYLKSLHRFLRRLHYTR
jgi:hypothetical protein